MSDAQPQAGRILESNSMADSTSRFIPLPPELKSDPLGALILRTRDQLFRLDRVAQFAYTQVNDVELRDELYRAVVVFTHAVLEDIVREAVRRRWRDWPDAALEKLSFPGERSNKASPRELKPFASLTVEQLIEKLAHEWLDKRSLSSTNDLCSLLQLIDIDIEEKLRPASQSKLLSAATLSGLQRFFERRHNIVHNGDYDRISKSRNPLDIDSVSGWTLAALCVISEILEAECETHPQGIILRQTLTSVFAELFRLDPIEAP